MYPSINIKRRVMDMVFIAVMLFALVCLTSHPTHKVVDFQPKVSTPNGSTDGRYHTCGYVTEDGVTEYLHVYMERCK